MVPLMPLTVTIFLEAAGRVIAGGVDLCRVVTSGLSRDVCEADRPSRRFSSCVGGVSRDESIKCDMLITLAFYCVASISTNGTEVILAYLIVMIDKTLYFKEYVIL